MRSAPLGTQLGALPVSEQIEHRATDDEADAHQAQRRDLVVEDPRLQHIGKGDLKDSHHACLGRFLLLVP